MLKYGNVLPYAECHTHCITIEEFGNTVFIATVQGTCTTLNVSQLLVTFTSTTRPTPD